MPDNTELENHKKEINPIQHQFDLIDKDPDLASNDEERAELYFDLAHDTLVKRKGEMYQPNLNDLRNRGFRLAILPNVTFRRRDNDFHQVHEVIEDVTREESGYLMPGIDLAGDRLMVRLKESKAIFIPKEMKHVLMVTSSICDLLTVETDQGYLYAHIYGKCTTDIVETLKYWKEKFDVDPQQIKVFSSPISVMHRGELVGNFDYRPLPNSSPDQNQLSYQSLGITPEHIINLKTKTEITVKDDINYYDTALIMVAPEVGVVMAHADSLSKEPWEPRVVSPLNDKPHLVHFPSDQA